MKSQHISDKVAIGLSLLCVAHCLLLPLALIALPALTVFLSFDHEVFHSWLLFAVIPISLFAFAAGYRNHHHRSAFFIGAFGLLLLSAAVLAGHDLIGELGEVVLTVAGSLVITLGHIRNFQLTRLKKPFCPQ